MFLVGITSALLASALFNLGVALQGLEARATQPDAALRLSLLGQLLRRRRWLLGLALGILGIGPQVLALATAPFVVVQTMLATGLLLLLVIAVRAFGERVGRLEVAGVAAIIAGVALVSWGAPPHSELHRGGPAVVGVVAGLSLLGLFPFAVRGTRLDTGMGVVIACGCGFGAANVATKLMSDDIAARHWTNALAWGLAALLMGVAATVTGMTAFQRRPATTVVPVSTAIQIFVPIVLEPLFLLEQWRAAEFGGAPTAAGVVCALIGSVLVSRARPVGELARAAQARPRGLAKTYSRAR